MRRIAYFGPEGTFTEQATRTFVAPTNADSAFDEPAASTDRSAPTAEVATDAHAPELIAAPTVPAALAMVRAGEADAACVPMENTVEGSVPATLDALSEGDPLVIVAETVLPIRFSVLVRPGTTSDDVRTVGTHPHAAAQVRDWLAEHLPAARFVPMASTAAGAVGVQRGEVDAAVTAPVAIQHYPLHVLASDVADFRDAFTRFLLVRRPGSSPAPSGADRTSLLFFIADETGTLAETLAELSLRGINMSRIESRPSRWRLGGPYRFFVDVDGHVDDARLGDALVALRRRCADVRFLGSYPRADGVRANVAPRTRDEDFAAAAEWLQAIRKGIEA